MNNAVKFRNTLDNLTTHQLRALVDVSEGYLSTFLNEWLRFSLEKRGLLFTRDERIAYCRQFDGTGLTPDYAYIEGLTDFGLAFVAWYRAPRDVPIQETLL